MKINCIGARASVTELDLMASGAANYYIATFTFDSAWDTYTYRWAVFKGSGCTIPVPLVADSCKVPKEVLAKATELLVGAIGSDGLLDPDPSTASVILTTNMVYAGTVHEGASTLASLAHLLGGD